MSVCPPARKEQRDFHWTDFLKIWYYCIFRKDGQKIHVLSRSILFRMRNISDKSCRENQNTDFMFKNHCFENRTAYKIRWKNTVGSDRPHGACALHAECLKIETHSKYVILIAFFAAITVAQMRLNVTLYLHCLSGLCLMLWTSVTRLKSQNWVVKGSCVVLSFYLLYTTLWWFIEGQKV
jgi:hypothetical protein